MPVAVPPAHSQLPVQQRSALTQAGAEAEPAAAQQRSRWAPLLQGKAQACSELQLATAEALAVQGSRPQQAEFTLQRLVDHFSLLWTPGHVWMPSQQHSILHT